MDILTISDLVGSSQYEAVADDSLKDEDNAAWVMTLEPHIRIEWIERISWIRLVDRLAENELVNSLSFEFHKFCRGWYSLLNQGSVEPDCPYQEVLTNMRSCWFGQFSTSADFLAMQAWNRYLEATACYHEQNLVIETLAQYKDMLGKLSGSCFQVLPFLPEKYWQVAYSFGALDQFFNNLRDMREDAEQGICYLPTELLEKFGVSRDEILQLTACQNPNYSRMMQFWLEAYLPGLKQNIHDLLNAKDLHPSWQTWRDWSLYRYRRIERIFRACNFNYVEFPQVYWVEVKRDLPLLLAQVRQEQHCTPATTSLYQSLQSQEEIAIPAILLELGNQITKIAEIVLNMVPKAECDRVSHTEIC